MDPLVSVLVPLYNSEKFVGQAVESVLSQTLADFELVIVDDGSTDSSASIVASYSDRRIRYIRNETNTGLAMVRNKALSLARGQFIAWLDSDDVSLPNRLALQVNLLRENPNVGLCGSWVRAFDTTHDVLWRYPTDAAVVRSRMLFDSPLATSATMMRRAVVEHTHPWFDPRFPPAEDYELWERISRRWLVTNIGSVLALYRLHAAQTSKLKEAQQRAAVKSVQLRQLDHLGIAPADDELELHLDIGAGWRFATDADAMLRTEAWLLKLDEANHRRHVFPTEAFRRVLAERWFLVARSVTHLGLSAWIRYSRSRLCRWESRPIRRITRLLIESSLHAGTS